MKLRVLALLLAVAMPSSAAGDNVPACFISATGENIQVSLEVARTHAERRKGLMGRETLKESHGMLFIYPLVNEPDRGFWMHQTLIPLDIAYLGASRTIAGIRTMEPCPGGSAADCPTYPAGVPYQYAVEMNAGFFEESGIKVGDRLVWNPDFQSSCNDVTAGQTGPE